MKRAILVRVMLLFLISIVGSVGLWATTGAQGNYDPRQSSGKQFLATQSNSLTQVNPSSCPSSGCAAGLSLWKRRGRRQGHAADLT